mgnify:CR=1 FL=1
MAKKQKTYTTPKKRENPEAVRFCLNCNDMDDLATSPEADDLDALHKRFEECMESGRFDGDLCARLFVAEDRIDDADLFADDDDEP